MSFDVVLLLIAMLGTILLAQETKNGTEDRGAPQEHLLYQDRFTEHQSLHVHVHDDANLTSPDYQISFEESKYFVLALFKRYSQTSRLSPNGFARLLCEVGLVPSLTETTKGADDASDVQVGDILVQDCTKLTFDKVEDIFAKWSTRREAHKQESDREDDYGDEHNDHEHVLNRNTVKQESTSRDGHDDDSGHSHNQDIQYEDNRDETTSNLRHNNDYNHKDNNSETRLSSESTKHVLDLDHTTPPGYYSSGNNGSNTQGHPRQKREVGRSSHAKTNSTHFSQPTVHVHSNHSECSSPKDLLEHLHLPLDGLDAQDFMLLCPALLYQLDSGVCGDHHHHHDHKHHHDEHEVSTSQRESIYLPLPGKVWGFSIASVVVISLAGLLGVAAVPIMQKVFYNHLLQFLVAVAVGALSGDALLHLLPHAISKNLSPDHGSHDDYGPDSHNPSHESEHLASVWKGLMALLCLFFFFLIERILTIVTEIKRRRKATARLKKKRCEQLCDAEKTGGVGAQLSAHEKKDFSNCEEMVMVVHPNRALKGFADATHEVLLHQCDEGLSQAEHAFGDDQDSSHTALGHSHSHAHGHRHTHCDTVPSSVAAVAWMVILGDGIHNFSDGLAIGAAFASGVAGGISTSIAIFCHELPHEIGDFAVLLRAGMTVKQAIVYNCISSILAFIGMLIGVAIGNIHNASVWIFSGVAGMFLYISMVDMLPEMTAVDPKKGENQYLHLLLQVVGIMFGSGIMLIIAVFEHDLQRMLD